jgi:hypothetical protein
MWTPATRVQHTRVSKRYQTDLTDAEWLLIAHMCLPPPGWDAAANDPGGGRLGSDPDA